MTSLEKENIISGIVHLNGIWSFLLQMWPGKTYSQSDVIGNDNVYYRFFDCPEKKGLWMDAFFFENGEVEISLMDGNDFTYFLNSVEVYNDKTTIHKIMTRCYDRALSIIDGRYDEVNQLPWPSDEEE